MEIDLLREGRRIGCHPKIDTHCSKKGYDYVVVISRSSKRSPRLQLELYGFKVRDLFPVVSIPLRDPDRDVLIDLGRMFRRAYETGPYRKVVRYDLPPDSPLPPSEAQWVREILERRGIIAPK